MTRKKATEAHVEPYPCQTTGCAGVLVPVDHRGEVIDKDVAVKWRCSRGGGPGCGFAADARAEDGELARCHECGGPVAFDAEKLGETVGGLRLKGWNYCTHCQVFWISRRGIPTHEVGDGDDGRWRIAGGGRSLDIGGIRLRPDGKGSPQQVKQLMARLSRLPAFEHVLEAIAAGMDGAAAAELARGALAIGENADQVDE